MPTRLALFTDSLYPSGVGRVMELLARHLPSAQYELFHVCADHPGADDLAARMSPYMRDTARFTVRWDEDVAHLPALVAQLQTWRIDIFHNHIGATWEGDWGTIAARCAHVPLVVATDHIPCVLKLEHELDRRRRVNGLLDRSYAVSESVRQSLIECGLIDAAKTVTVENGVDEIPMHLTRSQARRALNIPTAVPAALFLGRIVDQKDPYMLLHAIARLRSRGIMAHAIFAGDGLARHASEQEARRLDITEQVQFLGTCADVAPLFAAADVLAMPSRFEGMPLAALEAMSCGLPIVGCDADGVRDVVTRDVNGWLSPIGDPEAFADGLAQAFSETNATRWGRASRAIYEKRFTARGMADRQDRAYQEALASLGNESASSA